MIQYFYPDSTRDLSCRVCGEVVRKPKFIKSELIWGGGGAYIALTCESCLSEEERIKGSLSITKNPTSSTRKVNANQLTME